MLFMIPGKRETLRVSGRARVLCAISGCASRWRCATKSRPWPSSLRLSRPSCTVPSASFVRSYGIRAQWPDFTELAPLARVLIDHANLTCTLDEFQEIIDDSYQNNLY